MKPLRIPLKAVLYKEEQRWVAHCLEFDLLGDGDTRHDAFQSLSQAIITQVKASLKHKCMASLFTPAEGKYFKMYAAGKDIATGELQVSFQPIESVTLENLEAREYSDSVDSDADLVLT